MLKKYLILLVTLLILTLPVFAQDGDAAVNFTLTDASGAPGELVNIKLSISSSEVIDSIALHTLEYDPDLLTFVGFDNYTAFGNKCTFLTFDSDKKVISLALNSAEQVEDYICNIQFRIRENASGTAEVRMQSVAKNDTVSFSSAVSAAQVTVEIPQSPPATPNTGSGTSSGSDTPPNPPAHTHSLTCVPGVTATCLSAGVREHWTCADCGKNYADANAAVLLEKVTIPTDNAAHTGAAELRNREEPTEYRRGYSGDLYCTDCGRIIEYGEKLPALSETADEDDRNDKKDKEDKEDKPASSEPTDYIDLTDTAWKNPFTDVAESDPYYDSIRFVYENGLFLGVSATEFAPATTMTRAMFVTVLGRLAGVNELYYNAYPSSFTDVAAGEWYTAYVAWAASEGIVLGYGNGTFGLNDEITVEQAVVILARYARHLTLSTESAFALSAYTDAAGVADWALADMRWAAEYAVYTGTNGRLNPQTPAPRALVADMLYNYTQTFG